MRSVAVPLSAALVAFVTAVFNAGTLWHWWHIGADQVAATNLVITASATLVHSIRAAVEPFQVVRRNGAPAGGDR